MANNIELNVTWAEYRPLYERGLEVEERLNEIRKHNGWSNDTELFDEWSDLIKEESEIEERKRELRKHLIPEVGMPCTIIYYSDRCSGYVAEVTSPREIVVQEDGIYSGRKSYTFRKNGCWVSKGDTTKDWGTMCNLGYKHNYYDESF